MLSRRHLLAVFASLSLLAPWSAHAAKNPVAGTDYELIEPAVAGNSPGKVEVFEAFSYGCIHCAHAAEAVSKWRQALPAAVHFEYLPATFRPDFAMFARGYYTAETFGAVDKSHDALFKAIFVEQRPMRSLEDLAKFYADFGVKPDSFLLSTHGFVVDARLSRADDLQRKFAIAGTPTFVIAGKYRVQAKPGIDANEGNREMLETVDALIAKEVAALKK
jgi:thiol:disulfide interchange protein DsbA